MCPALSMPKNFFRRYIVRNCRGGHWPSGGNGYEFAASIGEFAAFYCRTSNARPYILNFSYIHAFSWNCNVHKKVFFCLRFRYSMFKTKKYSNNRKVAEAVSRLLSYPP